MGRSYFYTGASSYPSYLSARGQHLYFTADDGVHGFELWALVLESEPQKATIHLPLLVKN